MRFLARFFTPCTRRGFSLVELSITVAILGVVAALGLQMAASNADRTAIAVSRERLAVIDDALVRYFRIYGRLPCPASRTVAPSNTSEGIEDCTLTVFSGTTIGGGVIGGALPYRMLSLPRMFSLDGFNNRFNYVVTKNLTVAGGSSTDFNKFASSTGTTAQNGIGGIEVRTGRQEQPCNTTKCSIVADPNGANGGTGAAYLVASFGPDQRGAYSELGALRYTCDYPNPAAGTDARSDAPNCIMGDTVAHAKLSVNTIPYNVFYDNRYNPGIGTNTRGSVSYFNDTLIWRPKSLL